MQSGNLSVAFTDIYKNKPLHIEEDLYIIIQNCSPDKRDSQKKLYIAFYGYAIGICLRYAKNEDDAIEIMNDGFLKVFRELDKFVPVHSNPVPDFKAWMKKILVFTAIDHYRKNQKHQQYVVGMDEMTHQAAFTGETQLDKLSYKEIIENIQRLSPAYRTVFSLFVIDGFGHEEISKQLGISVGTSKSNLAKAKLNLQKMLETNPNYKRYERRAV